ncbi:aromatic ring-opening dioxygenase LigA [Lentzea aerocolonigenes]|uniref:Aromatic ring-opening dioxygenase LigA n=1 Tax=Lentzea aerocolonigenes TaxID=68170 RepID=A0A0F0HBV2_LENAE|nr:NAD(P)-binding domain-containing protein [Lentzea aerocolonigenes]KJK51113.1 aromatic ring-opening dioxygenase LigA [Lentzea aerocolonigenes]
MERVGIIGVGEIGRALVAGLRQDSSSPIFLSPRNAATAAALASAYPGVHVCGSNQEVVDNSDLVIIAVRGASRHEALAGLEVSGKLVVNVMAGVSNADLRSLLATDAPVVRAIPLPAVRERQSVTVVHPSHPVVNALFDRLGGALPVADEAAFDVFSALSGTLTTHYAYLATLASWASGQGIAPEDADRYIRGLFQGVGRSLSDESRSLSQLAADHETVGGSNERIRTTWFDATNSDALRNALDGLLAVLRH